MDTGYPNSERRHQSNVVIKHEPVEETMTGSGDLPVDMSVVPRDNRPEPSHCYMPAALTHDMSRGSYLSALYANKHIMHSQDALSAQHFLNQRHPHYPEPQLPQPQHPLVSPPSQRQQQEQQHKQFQSSPQQERSTVQVSPGSAHLPPKGGVPGFKLKDGSGKLALLDILSEDGSSPSMDFLPSLSGHQRAKREFVPENKKDEGYWNKRLKNNDSARRSRVKRKALEKMMESRLMELQKENIELRHEMAALKRRFGIIDETSSLLPPIPTGASSSASQEMSSDRSSSYSRDDELEQQSAGSDDSHSHDDSRSYNLGSVSVLSHSLGHSMRDRADSFGSGTSSGGRSSRPDSRASQPGNMENLVRTDKSGALDLSSSDTSNRSTPAQDSITLDNFEQKGRSKSESELEGERKNGQDMRGFPLKCRWKREMQSVATMPIAPASTPTNSE